MRYVVKCPVTKSLFEVRVVYPDGLENRTREPDDRERALLDAFYESENGQTTGGAARFCGNGIEGIESLITYTII